MFKKLWRMLWNNKKTETKTTENKPKPTIKNPLSRSRKTAIPPNANTRNHIGKGTMIDGEIECEGDIRVDGILHGYLKCMAKVVVGPTGFIKGDVICENADISGNIEGKIQVKELLFLQNSAYIKGDIVTNKLVIDSGAKFNGSCDMNSTIAIDSKKGQTLDDVIGAKKDGKPTGKKAANR